MIRKRWAVVTLGAAIVFVFGIGAGVMAGGSLVTTGQANDLAVIKVVTEDEGPSTTSDTFQAVSNAVRRATSTASGTLFVARFSAFVDAVPNGDCQVRIAVKDLASSTLAFMNPDFDRFTDSTNFVVTIERSIKSGTQGVPATGTFDFEVQFRSEVSGEECDLDAWHFTLERYT